MGQTTSHQTAGGGGRDGLSHILWNRPPPVAPSVCLGEVRRRSLCGLRPRQRDGAKGGHGWGFVALRATMSVIRTSRAYPGGGQRGPRRSGEEATPSTRLGGPRGFEGTAPGLRGLTALRHRAGRKRPSLASDPSCPSPPQPLPLGVPAGGHFQKEGFS